MNEVTYKLRKAWRASCLNCGFRRRCYFLDEGRRRALIHEKHNPGHKVRLDFRDRPRLRAAGAVVFALALLFSSSSSAAEKEDKGSVFFRVVGLVTYVGSTGDVVSTEVVLSRGGVELNPLQRHRAVRVTTHALFPVGFNWFTDEIRKNGRPKLALWMRIGANVALAYVTVRNLRLEGKR